jgi:2-hydroxy-3-keto-5-methylthiopentenyl-1-phosphate phosphatase
MINVFIDFDGTITKGDVGDLFFEKFAGKVATQTVADYRSGLINAMECFDSEAAACKSLSLKAVDKFLDEQKIDSAFVDFVSFCNQHQDGNRAIRTFIVSDGLDYYISRILSNYGLSNIPFYANHAEFNETENGIELHLDYPYTDEECSRCACCKRNLLLTSSSDEDIIVYIGEGFSDFCPVKYADIVFAKDELQANCQKENITYYYYKNFQDIIIKMEEILQKKRIPKRQQAVFNRRDILMAG